MEESLLSKLKAVNTDIKNKNFSPIYFIYGEETFFIESIEKNIKKEFIDNTGLNVKCYHDENYNIEEIVNYIESMPFMNEKKLIIFKNLDVFRVKKDKENDAKKILAAMEKAIDVNVIVVSLYETAYKYQDKFGKSNKICEFARNKGVVIDSKKLKENELEGYVKNHFKKLGYEIDSLALAYFIRNAGKSIGMLYKEADKIAAYLDKPQKITKEIVDKCISRNIEENVFTLMDLITSQKQNEAYKLYGDLLSEGESEFAIFANFTTNYENLLLVKDLTEQSKTLKDICTITKLPEWRVRKYQNTNRGLTKETIVSKLNKITKLQVECMRGNLDSSLMLELLFT